jgi:hypothetical protein
MSCGGGGRLRMCRSGRGSSMSSWSRRCPRGAAKSCFLPPALTPAPFDCPGQMGPRSSRSISRRRWTSRRRLSPHGGPRSGAGAPRCPLICAGTGGRRWPRLVTGPTDRRHGSRRACSPTSMTMPMSGSCTISKASPHMGAAWLWITTTAHGARRCWRRSIAQALRTALWRRGNRRVGRTQWPRSQAMVGRPRRTALPSEPEGMDVPPPWPGGGRRSHGLRLANQRPLARRVVTSTAPRCWLRAMVHLDSSSFSQSRSASWYLHPTVSRTYKWNLVPN